MHSEITVFCCGVERLRNNRKGEYRCMKIKRVLFWAWLIMLVVAVGFLLYAVNNPQGHFPWRLSTTYMIYRVYLITIASCFITWLILKLLRKLTFSILRLKIPVSLIVEISCHTS